jgi:hypothetical protein
MAIINERCGKLLIHCKLECIVVQLLWEVNQEENIVLTYDPEILLLSICSGEMNTYVYMKIQM